jgi:hypothetical protein
LKARLIVTLCFVAVMAGPTTLARASGLQANAGVSQQVKDANGDGREAVTLDGSGSANPDGAISSYVWKEFAGSGFTPVATGRQAQVTLGLGKHQMVLTVADDKGATSQAMVVITVTSDFAGPTANAGADSVVPDTVRTGTVSVSLDGSASKAGSGDITSYIWKENCRQIATGVSATVSLNTTAKSMHDIQLTVMNSHGLTNSTVKRLWVMPKGTYFVDGAKGSDENPGTVEKPFKTINKAVGAAVPDTVIIVRAGIYYDETLEKLMYHSGAAGHPDCPKLPEAPSGAWWDPWAKP